MMQARSMILARLRSPSRMVVCRPPHWNHPVNHAGLRSVATTSTIQTEQVLVSKTKAPLETPSAFSKAKEEKKGVVVEACGDVDDDDDEMEQEEMFIAAHESFGHDMVEWGGPRRGGRLLEPTRFGDWERKGRCTDF